MFYSKSFSSAMRNEMFHICILVSTVFMKFFASEWPAEIDCLNAYFMFFIQYLKSYIKCISPSKTFEQLNSFSPIKAHSSHEVI